MPCPHRLRHHLICTLGLTPTSLPNTRRLLARHCSSSPGCPAALLFLVEESGGLLRVRLVEVEAESEAEELAIVGSRGTRNI